MAVILKKPNKNNKGIIIVTHKEGRTNNQFKPYRKHYLIGTHVGWDLSDFTPRVLANEPDFILSSFSHLGNGIPKDIVIELNARNFLPNHFNYKNKDKQYLLDSIEEVHKFSSSKISEQTLSRIKNSNDENMWDLVWINRTSNSKNIKEFVDNVLKLFRTYGKVNVLMVCAINDLEKSKAGKNDHLNIEQYINTHFTDEEKSHLDLLRPDSDGGCLGVDNKFIAPFYHWSKVYGFFSPVEGDARALHEALCGNCQVVYYKHLKGAGKDYLKEDNSFSFESYEESYKTLYEAINSDKTIDLDYINERCFQDKSIEVLKDKLKPIYKKIGQEFDGKLLDVKNLNIELPAHNHKVPWRDRSNLATGDLAPHMFQVFVKNSGMLLDEDNNPLTF